VEDESTIAMLYKELLEAYGFVVVDVAKNGEEAVHKYKNFKMKPDVVIMDHRMPIKSGIEATEEILEFDKNAKIIFASADKTVKEIALSIGALIFEEKPFDNTILIDDINKLIGK
jgi:two-component system chemotaxis response regulator CheY